MKPTQVKIRANRDDGSIWLTYEKPGARIKPLRDVTNDVMLALCADISAQLDNPQSVDRTIRFADGMVCKITVHMEQGPTDG